MSVDGRTKNVIMIAMFTALIAVGAFIRIPIPVCPFTLQFLFTTLAGIVLGKNRGSIATSLYVLLGLLGLPIFSGGGGIGYIFKPTFGYLIGFILGSYVTGLVIYKKRVTYARLLTGCILGLITVYALGMFYYYMISALYLKEPIGFGVLFLYCFVLAVPGDIALCILASSISKRLLPIINSKGNL